MGPDEERIISCYNICFFCGMLLFPCVEAGFTRFPPSVLYISSGGTARFVWDYHVNNRDIEFKSASPAWYFIDQATLADSKIGYDDLYKPGEKWGFVISRATCPPRLLNPDRVRREPKSTLVITNVTTDDDGIYQCLLDFIAGNPEKHESQLVVTVRPNFLPHHPENTYQFIEGDDSNISCTATGPPTPNVTWVNVTEGNDDTKSQGSGSAILHIPTITRYQAGVYECQARNNPKETASTTRTRVTVYYEPSISKELSSSQVSSWNGRRLTLDCTVSDGIPTPSITWYRPSGQQILTGITAVSRRSQVVITTNSADYGLYKCKATNIAGIDEHLIDVTQLTHPGPVTISIVEVEASALTIRWSKPDDGGSSITDYLLEVTTKLPEITGNNHAVITGLKAGTRYTVKVSARSIAGYGATSTTSVKTKLTGKPSIPYLLAVRLERQDSKLSVFLRWTRPDQNGANITHYTIYMKEVKPEADWIKHHDVNNARQVSSRIKDNIIYGKTYKFLVTAWNKYGESVKDEESAKTVNTTADIETAVNAMKYFVVEGPKSFISSAVLGVIIALLVLSLVVHLLQFVYMKRRVNLSRNKESQEAQSRKIQIKTGAEESYENDFELEDNLSSAAKASRAPPVQTGPEYETINKTAEIAKSNEIRPVHTGDYQEVNMLPNTSTQGPVYEPLRKRSDESRIQHSDNSQHPYEPLNVRHQNTTYQSLHKNGNESAI